ncbi:hypothetical protein [Aeromicrobium sp. Leaf291]|uniref:hypothetical protein n=1 Tax=Aeromicrobium sp. Leaf291 TaxID=1736325 RepID=UPI0006F3D797|nr:hypothetical protein [Aeromicrobium sp. Leaf291]KQP83738.1 hypothetical protein ASF35_01805 [Aeromicrobium sp. Leaf291]
MSTEQLQIVDGISETPTVLLDLHNSAPLCVAQNGFSSPPPALRESASAALGDGDIVTGSSYADRVMTINLHVLSDAQGASLEALQALHRFVDSAGFWLRRVPAGGSSPTFYRVKRSPLAAINEYNGRDDGLRTVQLDLRADPFGYGLPVSGTFSIGADPTSGGVSYVWPDEVQGDVPAPLQLSHAAPDLGEFRRWFSMAGSSDAWPAFLHHSQMTAGSSGGGITVSTYSGDPALVTGSATRLLGTKTGSSRVASGSLSLPAGDYRVFLLGDQQEAGAPVVEWSLSTYPYDNDPVLRSGVREPWFPNRWTDLGLARLPEGAPMAAEASMRWGASSELVEFRLDLETAGLTDAMFEGLLFVPARLDEAVMSEYLGVKAPGSAVTAWVDGADRAASFVDAYGRTLPAAVGSLVGLGWPSVTPGQINVLHSLDTQNSLVNEPLDVTFRYFPRYLYARPALS